MNWFEWHKQDFHVSEKEVAVDEGGFIFHDPRKMGTTRGMELMPMEEAIDEAVPCSTCFVGMHTSRVTFEKLQIQKNHENRKSLMVENQCSTEDNMRDEEEVRKAAELAEQTAAELDANENPMEAIAPILIAEGLNWVLEDSERDLMTELEEDVEELIEE